MAGAGRVLLSTHNWLSEMNKNEVKVSETWGPKIL